jgi:hypothetical protein
MQKEVRVIAAKFGWIVQAHGETVSVHQTEGVAVERARKAAKRSQSDLVVHGRDGKVRCKVPFNKRHRA